MGDYWLTGFYNYKDNVVVDSFKMNPNFRQLKMYQIVYQCNIGIQLITISTPPITSKKVLDGKQKNEKTSSAE